MRLKFEGEDCVKLSPRVLVTQQDKKEASKISGNNFLLATDSADI